jgi:hypothetical protein
VPKETAASRKSAALAAAAGAAWGQAAPPAPGNGNLAQNQPKKLARKKNMIAGGGGMDIMDPPTAQSAMSFKEGLTPTGIKDKEGIIYVFMCVFIGIYLCTYISVYSWIQIFIEIHKYMYICLTLGNGVIQKEHNNMIKIMKEMTTSNERQVKVEKNDKEIQSTSHISTTTERKFFDQVKEMLTSVSRESWAEFVRCLDLFSCDAIVRKDLLSLVQVKCYHIRRCICIFNIDTDIENCLYVYMYKYINTHIYMYMYIYVYIHVCIYIFILLYVNTLC